MIKGIYIYDSQIVNNIEDKYSKELKILRNLEHNLRRFQVNNQTTRNTITQHLLNLRHSLVRIQIKRLIDRKGKKLLEDD